MPPLAACHTPPCPPGLAVADPAAHEQWHADVRDRGPGEHDVTVGDLVGAWLDELDAGMVEQMVMASESTMTESPVAVTLEVLRKLARQP